MGLSSIYLNQILVILALTSIMGLALSQASLDESRLDLKEYAENIQREEGQRLSITGYNYTNLTGVDNISIHYLNNGSNTINTEKLSVFLDGEWVAVENRSWWIDETTFDPLLLNPGETLIVNVNATLPVGDHTIKIATDACASKEDVFYANRCPDGTCTTGEYCSQDKSDCPDNVCYEPACADGCTQTPYSGEEDPGECDSSGNGCTTNNCICDSSQDCCGVDGSTTCSTNEDCCNYCGGDTCVEKTCDIYCTEQGYADGTCRANSQQCTNNAETYESGGDQYCTGGASADTCCCTS